MASHVMPVTGQDAFAITKSDSTVIRFDAIWVGGAGDVTVRTARGSTVAFPGAAAGTIIPITGDRVMAATTATNLVGIIY